METNEFAALIISRIQSLISQFSDEDKAYYPVDPDEIIIRALLDFENDILYNLDISKAMSEGF